MPKYEQVTLQAGPGGVFQPGKVRSLTKEEAAPLLVAGAITPVVELEPEPEKKRVRKSNAGTQGPDLLSEDGE